jgi:hypothetical protein
MTPVPATRPLQDLPMTRRGLPGRLPAPALLLPLLLTLLAPGLAGCAAPPAPKPPPAPVAAAAPAGPPDWDGAYHGTSTRYRAALRDCPHPGVLTLYVAQSTFYYRWTGGLEIPGTVGPDGTITGGDGNVRLTGAVRGRLMEGDVSDPACGLHFTVTRRF